MLAVQLVSGTVKLAMQDVSEAVSTAFDPEAKPEDLAKAMEKLAPAAKEFVTELQGMRKEFTDLQQQVQENFFAGLDDTLVGLKEDVLPQVGDALRNVATELSSMASGAGEAAAALGRDGTLGTALEGAVNGIANLVDVPGQAVTALGQLAAAAAPAFERVTAAAASSASSVSEKLAAAFESGALDEAINSAVDAIAQLGRIAGNVFGGLGNIIGTATASGEGLFAMLERVTQAFEDVTASQGFQQALRALVETAGVVADTVLPSPRTWATPLRRQPCARGDVESRPSGHRAPLRCAWCPPGSRGDQARARTAVHRWRCDLPRASW
jgi:phage-related protein